jgi:prepilin-type N-terminal cleavage/methylation domain-containing protein
MMSFWKGSSMKYTSKFSCSGKSGYTLVEILIASSVMALISIGLFTVMEGHIGNFQTGTHHIRIQHELQRVIKQLYVDFKKINTHVVIDSSYNVWFNGENTDNMKLNKILLRDLDLDRTNGYEGLEFTVNLIDPLGSRQCYWYGLEKDSSDKTVLYRKVDDDKKVFSEYVKSLKFNINPYDKREVLVEGTIEIPGRTSTDTRKEDFDMVLRVEHSYVVVSAE